MLLELRQMSLREIQGLIIFVYKNVNVNLITKTIISPHLQDVYFLGGGKMLVKSLVKISFLAATKKLFSTEGLL